MNTNRVLIPRITRVLIPVTMLCLCAARTSGAPPVGPGALTPSPRTELRDFVPPPVQIACPTPPEDTLLLSPPNIQISWNRTEHGHGFPRPPFQYKFILLGPGSEFPLRSAVVKHE